MILVDAGPLVALVDADDQHQEQCVSTLKSLKEPLATVWPLLGWFWRARFSLARARWVAQPRPYA
jgi:predicted nucleic acid-binding protein